MSARNDYRCNGCGVIVEGIGGPPSPCKCGYGPWEVVFTETPQVRTQHAYVTDHVIQKNKERMEQVYEEDAASGSQALKDLEAITTRAIVDPKEHEIVR